MLDSTPANDCLNIYFSNFRSLENKLSELITTIETLKLNIIIANESWFNDSIPVSFLNNYQIYRRDRLGRRGGIFIAAHNTLKTIRIIEYECQILESLCVELQINDLKILFITIYLLPPVNSNKFKLIENILTRIENSNTCYDEIILVGDLNTDFNPNSSGELNFNAKQLNDIFLNYKMKQLVKRKYLSTK